MVKLTKIYTKTGDDGATSLADGARRPKNDARIKAYGTIDEANSALGIAKLHLEEPVLGIILALQNDLFDVGADLATPTSVGDKALRVTQAQVLRLETEIDQLNGDLSPLNSFILPGGTHGAAYLHLARTILRRAEREIIEMQENPGEEASLTLRQFVNRASDLAFVAARWANDKGACDVLWQPAKNQTSS